ncbi:MAG: hypothetical protein ABWZ25_01655 [Chitinophagaceae bacterium]
MKKLIIATVFSGLVLVSCQKADKEEMYPANNSITETTAKTTGSGWLPVVFTAGSADDKGKVTAEGTLSSDVITDEILADGIVLLFSKDENAVNMLPYQNASTEWNYTVSKGQIDVTAVGNEAVKASSIQYVVVPASKIAELEKTGYSRNDLVNISFEKASALFGLQ